MRRDRDEREERPDADLRERLHAMEAKVRKLREIRNQHSDKARRSRDQRNAVQAQYKEHRETVDLLIAEVKAIRAEVNLHRERRNGLLPRVPLAVLVVQLPCCGREARETSQHRSMFGGVLEFQIHGRPIF